MRPLNQDISPFKTAYEGDFLASMIFALFGKFEDEAGIK